MTESGTSAQSHNQERHPRSNVSELNWHFIQWYKIVHLQGLEWVHKHLHKTFEIPPAPTPLLISSINREFIHRLVIH